jgi:hypothetical protein
MNIVSYTPQTTGGMYTDANGIELGQNHVVFAPGNSTPSTLTDAFEQTCNQINSGINIGLTGVGALHLLTQAQNAAQGFAEPAVITNLRTAALGTLNIIAVSYRPRSVRRHTCLTPSSPHAQDFAVDDLDGRAIGSSFLCTESEQQWKSAWSLIALVLGNNASLFGAWLVISVSVMRKWEERRYGPLAAEPRPVVIPTLRQDSSMARLPRCKCLEISASTYGTYHR